MLIAFQIGIIVFLASLLIIVYQDERRKLKLGRKSAKLNSFWSQNREGKDRRKSIRINAEINVLYEVISGETIQRRVSLSRNISLGGINLALDEKLFPGAVLNLELSVPKVARPIFIQGKVVWIEEISGKVIGQNEGRTFASGIQFIQIKPEAEAVLNNFINQSIKDGQEQNQS